MYRKWERNEPPVTIYSPHFLPSTWCSIISQPFNVDHTYSGIWKRLIPSTLESADWNCDCYTMNVPNWFWKLLITNYRKRQCLYHRHPDICTRAMQGTKEALTVIKYPWGLHTVHGQCFMCGMWCSIVKWLHCSMVLQKSITRIWINLAASLEYLSEVVC